MEEIETRLDIIKQYGEGKVVAEIGVFRGDFSKQIWHEAEPKELILIDPWIGAGHSGDDDGKITYCADLEEYGRAIDRYFATNFHVQVIRGYSYNELLEYPDCLDLIYIDGNHDLRDVLIDLTLAKISVKDRGWISCHDYHGAVKDVIDYWAGKMGYVVQHTTQDKIPSCYMQNNKY